jgi:hypothetical protein
MPADRSAWAPEVVEAVGRRIDPERWAQLEAMDPNDRAFLPLMIAERMRVDAALAASPLPHLLDLLDIIIECATTGDGNLGIRGHKAVADAAAFVARCGEGK